MNKKPRPKTKRTTTRSVLRLPDLEHAKAAVLTSLTSRDAPNAAIVMPSTNSSTGIVQNRI